MAAVGTLTIATANAGRGPARPITRVVLSWTSNAAGTVSGILTGPLTGELLRVVFTPGTGDVAPTAAYDAVLLDEAGADVLAGQGANLSATVPLSVCPGIALKDGTTTSIRPAVIDDQLELQITNAGDGNSGTVTLYIR